MDERRTRRRAALWLAWAALLSVLSPRSGALPDALVLRAGGETELTTFLPLSAEVQGSAVTAGNEEGQLRLTAGDEAGSAAVVLRLLGLPVKTVNVTVEPASVLIPGGSSLGVAVLSDGVIVVGASDLGSQISPARAAGIKTGDIIQTVNGERVTSSEEITARLDGGKAVLGILRDGESREVEVVPATDPRDGAKKLGVWVRRSTAGVGTLTYYDPETATYGALGHAVTDADTGVMFSVGEGAVYENRVVQVTKGAQGVPGELKGAFFEEETQLGDIRENTDFGIFGSATRAAVGETPYPLGLPVAAHDEVHTGAASILTTVEGGEVREYDCEIEKLYRQDAPETRSMILRITDEALLSRTGGIVQGMSGSPILQDGRIIGAVTHVLVNDPTRGYGVYIEWMLKNSKS